MNNFAFKLTTGEFVYGSLKERDEKIVVIENPLVWEEITDEEGRIHSTLIKFISGTDETDIPISTTSIVSMAKMSPKFEEFYEASVVIQGLSETAYNNSLDIITKSMHNYINEHYAKIVSEATGELISYKYHKLDGSTIH